MESGTGKEKKKKTSLISCIFQVGKLSTVQEKKHTQSGAMRSWQPGFSCSDTRALPVSVWQVGEQVRRAGAGAGSKPAAPALLRNPIRSSQPLSGLLTVVSRKELISPKEAFI